MNRRARTPPRAATPAATRKTVAVRSKNTTAAARQRDRGPWIESPQWDGFWMLNGLWLFGLLVVARLGNLTATVSNGQFVLAMLLWGGAHAVTTTNGLG